MDNFGIKVRFEFEPEFFLEKIDEFAEENNYGYTVEDNKGNIRVVFEILPYLFIFFEINEKIEVKIDSCYYGLGYHKLVVDFIDEFSEFLEIPFDVYDDTSFYFDKDMSRLEEYYNNWIKQRVEYVLNNKDNIRAKSIFVNNQNTFPITDDDYICTYTGILSFTEFEKLYEDGLEKLKDRVFLFNKPVFDAFTDENFLLYHVWNNLKDLTLVEDFDERLSLTMFMFENLIENNIQIHLPQKYAREIYKYLGVDKFSASNFIYRKVKYEVGYHYFDHLLADLDFDLIIPSWYLYNNKISGYTTTDNAIFIYEYKSDDDFCFDSSKLIENKDKDLKILVNETSNFGKMFLGINMDDEYGYIPIDRQNELNCEDTVCQIIDKKNKRMYEISVLGLDSREIIEHMIRLL